MSTDTDWRLHICMYNNAAKYNRYTSGPKHVQALQCRLLKICIVWTSLKMFCLGDMASFACHHDWQLGSFLIKSTAIVFDTIINGIVYEPLATSDNYQN